MASPTYPPIHIGPWGRPMPPNTSLRVGGQSGYMLTLPIARFSPPPSPPYIVWVAPAAKKK